MEDRENEVLPDLEVLPGLKVPRVIKEDRVDVVHKEASVQEELLAREVPVDFVEKWEQPDQEVKREKLVESDLKDLLDLWDPRVVEEVEEPPGVEERGENVVGAELKEVKETSERCGMSIRILFVQQSNPKRRS